MKTKSKNFLHEEEIKWGPVGENIERQVMGYDGQCMLVKVKFNKTGAVGALHSHYHTQTSYVVSGKFELTIGEESRILSTGDAFYIEPDVIHGCICLEPGILIDCFSPMRADFLEK